MAGRKSKIKNKDIKKNINSSVTHDDSDMNYSNDSPSAIATDKWRNGWDTSGEFSDMDFRLVDDE